ncbi:sister chromatid cohesion protein 1 [Rhodotorula toruloides]
MSRKGFTTSTTSPAAPVLAHRPLRLLSPSFDPPTKLSACGAVPVPRCLSSSPLLAQTSRPVKHVGPLADGFHFTSEQRDNALEFVEDAMDLPPSIAKSLYSVGGEKRAKRLRKFQKKAARELEKRGELLVTLDRYTTLPESWGYLTPEKTPSFLPSRDQLLHAPSMPRLVPRTDPTATQYEDWAPPGPLAPDLRALYMFPTRREQIRLEGRERKRPDAGGVREGRKEVSSEGKAGEEDARESWVEERESASEDGHRQDEGVLYQDDPYDLGGFEQNGGDFDEFFGSTWRLPDPPACYQTEPGGSRQTFDDDTREGLGSDLRLPIPPACYQTEGGPQQAFDDTHEGFGSAMHLPDPPASYQTEMALAKQHSLYSHVQEQADRRAPEDEAQRVVDSVEQPADGDLGGFEHDFPWQGDEDNDLLVQRDGQGEFILQAGEDVGQDVGEDVGEDDSEGGMDGIEEGGSFSGQLDGFDAEMGDLERVEGSDEEMIPDSEPEGELLGVATTMKSETPPLAMSMSPVVHKISRDNNSAEEASRNASIEAADFMDGVEQTGETETEYAGGCEREEPPAQGVTDEGLSTAGAKVQQEQLQLREAVDPKDPTEVEVKVKEEEGGLAFALYDSKPVEPRAAQQPSPSPSPSPHALSHARPLPTPQVVEHRSQNPYTRASGRQLTPICPSTWGRQAPSTSARPPLTQQPRQRLLAPAQRMAHPLPPRPPAQTPLFRAASTSSASSSIASRYGTSGVVAGADTSSTAVSHPPPAATPPSLLSRLGPRVDTPKLDLLQRIGGRAESSEEDEEKQEWAARWWRRR